MLKRLHRPRKKIVMTGLWTEVCIIPIIRHPGWVQPQSCAAGTLRSLRTI